MENTVALDKKRGRWDRSSKCNWKMARASLSFARARGRRTYIKRLITVMLGESARHFTRQWVYFCILCSYIIYFVLWCIIYALSRAPLTRKTTSNIRLGYWNIQYNIYCFARILRRPRCVSFDGRCTSLSFYLIYTLGALRTSVIKKTNNNNCYLYLFIF